MRGKICRSRRAQSRLIGVRCQVHGLCACMSMVRTWSPNICKFNFSSKKRQQLQASPNKDTWPTLRGECGWWKCSYIARCVQFGAAHTHTNLLESCTRSTEEPANCCYMLIWSEWNYVKTREILRRCCGIRACAGVTLPFSQRCLPIEICMQQLPAGDAHVCAAMLM